MSSNVFEGDISTMDIPEFVLKAIEYLESSDEDERSEGGRILMRHYTGSPTSDIARIIEQYREDPTIALFSWAEFCLLDGTGVLYIDFLGKVIADILGHYQGRVQVLLHITDGEKKSAIQSHISEIQYRVQKIANLILSQPDQEMRSLGYYIMIKLMEVSGESPQKIREFLENCPEYIRYATHPRTVLADAYEREGHYDEAYTIQQTLQLQTGELSFLSAQITLLFRMGRDKEAISLYNFARDTASHGELNLLPIFVYRGRLTRMADLEELYRSLYTFYRGEKIDSTILFIMHEAERFILKRLKRVEGTLRTAKKRRQNVYNPQYQSLWIKKLFLLEVLVGMLGNTGPNYIYPEGAALEYILTLENLYEAHREGNTILESYFNRYEQNWMESVRSLHGEDIHSEGTLPFPYGLSEQTSHQDGSEIKEANIPERVYNILDFLLDRVENDRVENKELMHTILGFQRDLSIDIYTLPNPDLSDIFFSGDQIRRALTSLSEEDRSLYEGLKKYVEDEFGTGVLQHIFFLSSNCTRIDDFDLSGLRKDPKILLLVLAIALLGLNGPIHRKLSEFASDSIFEALGEEETIFLMRMMYRAGMFRDICEYLLNDSDGFGYALCLEIWFLSLTHLPNEVQGDYLQQALEEIENMYGDDSFPEFFQRMRGEMPENEDSIRHAELIYTALTDKDADLQVQFSQFEAKKPPIQEYAGVQFTALRIMEVTLENRQNWLISLISIYPHLGIEKKIALSMILDWSFYLGQREQIVRHLTLAYNDGIPVGYWIYAPLLLGTEEEKWQGIEGIAKDPLLYSLPEPIIDWIRKNYSKGIEDVTGKEFTLEQKFQVSYILAYSGSTPSEQLANIVQHFSRLNEYLYYLHSLTGGSEEIFWKKGAEIFTAIDYTGESDDDSLEGENIDIPKRESVLYSLLNHISEFRRYLTISELFEDDDFLEGEAVVTSLQDVLHSLISIAYLFTPDSREYSILSLSIEQIRIEGWKKNTKHARRVDYIIDQREFPHIGGVS